MYDYENKIIDISEKTREKVTHCAPRPTVRTFAAAVGILKYATRTLAVPQAPFYLARRAISEVSWLLTQHDEL